MNESFISSYEKKSLSFKLAPRVHQALKFYSLDNRCTMQHLVEHLIEDFVQSKGLLKPTRSVKKKVSKK